MLCKSIILILILFNGVFYKALESKTSSKFKLGNEVLLNHKLPDLKSKKIGLITNQTGILSNGTHLLDALIEKDVKVVKIFSPEHGIRGDESYSNVDEKTGIPIVSLYEEKQKPSPSDLDSIDILIYDIQDVGARFYTYTSTLYYAMESAIENNVKLIVCDRPVIINPNYIDGFMLDTAFKSFVGTIPSPVCYGMTCGELANYLSDVIYNSLPYVRPPFPIVEVSKMESYSRTADFNSLNLEWVKPSPNMFTSSTAVCYPASCFLEGTNVSEGRGTAKPFEYFGAPWCNSNLLAEELNSFKFEGVVFEAVNFTPNGKISAYTPKFFNKECSGVYIKVTDKNKFESVKVGVAILASLKKLFPEFEFNKDNFIDKLAGTDRLRKMVSSGSNYNTIVSSWEEELKKFKEEREKYLLY